MSQLSGRWLACLKNKISSFVLVSIGSNMIQLIIEKSFFMIEFLLREKTFLFFYNPLCFVTSKFQRSRSIPSFNEWLFVFVFMLFAGDNEPSHKLRF